MGADESTNAQQQADGKILSAREKPVRSSAFIVGKDEPSMIMDSD